jgi:hypothetical protein
LLNIEISFLWQKAAGLFILFPGLAGQGPVVTIATGNAGIAGMQQTAGPQSALPVKKACRLGWAAGQHLLAWLLHFPRWEVHQPMMGGQFV